MKILHIAQAAGGVEVYLSSLVKGLIDLGVECGLICDYGYDAEAFRQMGCQVWTIPMARSLNPLKHRKTVAEIKRIIREWKPDVVYCHSSFAGAIGRVAAHGEGPKVVYNPHGWAFQMKGSKLKQKIYVVIERMLAMMTDRIITISNFEELAAIDKRIAPMSKFQTIFNGIDLNTKPSSSVSRASLGFTDQDYLIGMVGRISEQKAPDVFLRMAARVKDAIPQAKFIIVGDGDERKEIERLAASLGIARDLTITGWVTNPNDYTAMLDQGVLLSRWEGFGLVLAEMMNLGVPIVATAVDAIPDLIVDHENGILVSPDNDSEAADAVVEIYRDKELRKRITENSKLRAQVLFDSQRVARQTYRVLNHLVTKSIAGGVKR